MPTDNLLPPSRQDALDVLRTTKDPVAAEQAMRDMYDAGFRDVAGIARDCGWLIVRHTAIARYIGMD